MRERGRWGQSVRWVRRRRANLGDRSRRPQVGWEEGWDLEVRHFLRTRLPLRTSEAVQGYLNTIEIENLWNY